MNKPDCPPSPFVGLVPFFEVDAPFFRGRDTERDLIVENLRASRLTLLYGTSGVGKSSVLYAGAAHRLRELARQDVLEYGKPEFAVVTFRAWWEDDPIQVLLRSINEAMAEALQVKSLVDVPRSDNLARTIGAWTERYGIELLIILDQFEEYFQYHPNEQGPGTFAEEFPRAVNDPELRGKFLLSLRDDALSKLDRFKSQIPYLFDNLLRIRHMTAEAARKAIKEPIDEYNERCGFRQAGTEYSIESALVEEVIKQVRAGRDADGPGGATGIEAPYLQLVMTRLWEKEREEGSRVLRRQTLEDLKGIKNIVQVYLNNALDQLTPEQKSVAFRIFNYLVTPSGTKIAYFKSDLIGQTGFTETQVGGVLDALNKSRILRPVEPPVDRPTESRYEVFHDLLALAIINWRTLYEATTKAEAEQATAAAELAEAERQRRLAAQARENRRLRLGLTLLVLLVISAVGFALFAYTKRTEAQAASQLASEKEAAAKESEAKAKVALQRVSVEKERANNAANSASAAQQEAEKALKNERVAKEEATKQARLAAERLVKVEELQKELDRRIEQELDPMKRKALMETAALFRGERQVFLTRQEKLAIKRQQQRESGSGRPIATEDEIKQNLWQNGKTLRISFLDGPPELHRRVEEVAQEWIQTGANIKFEFGASPNAEIRITFETPGRWSLLGSNALGRSGATMGLGLLTQPDIAEDVFRRAVLHEFGHMLGLVHEHQRSAAGIRWNVPAAIAYYTSPPFNWISAMVEQNVFRTYRAGEGKKFDPKSIMLYVPIPKEVVLGKDFEPVLRLSSELSEGDKEFIRALYPRP